MEKFNQIEYVNRYNKEHYANFSVRLPIEYKEKAKLAVKKKGCFSLATFFKKCIDETLDSPEV